ncbi:MAG: hypothetical protein AAF394_07350 [Planctomycetota bacterium]
MTNVVTLEAVEQPAAYHLLDKFLLVEQRGQHHLWGYTIPATYLYHDANRYWYSTQPTVTKLAEDRAEQLKSDPESMVKELEKRIRRDLSRKGDFGGTHPLPKSGSDVTDDPQARLVVLGIEHPYSKDGDSPALNAAKLMLESKGSSPRLYRNAVVFLALDRNKLQDLDEAVRRYLAWESIVQDSDTLNLSSHQHRQATSQMDAASTVVDSRIPEAYQWLLVPTQATPQSPVEWTPLRLTGQEAMAVRASKKLRNDEMLITDLAGTRLRLELDNVPLWRGDHVSLKQLAEDFARYTYLPRLRDSSVLINAARDGLGLLIWPKESFAYSDSYDESNGRYLGLKGGQNVAISEDSLFGLLVKPDVAIKQLEAEQPQRVSPTNGVSDPTTTPSHAGVESTALVPGSPEGSNPAEPPKPQRFHGTVPLDPQRVGRDAGKIAEEVIAHLSSLIGAEVMVRLDIEAVVPPGIPDNVVRIVTENCRTLKFESQGFEEE